MTLGVPWVPRVPGVPGVRGVDPRQLQPGWRQPQRSSVMPFASLQCSEQYFPNSLLGGTVQ